MLVIQHRKQFSSVGQNSYFIQKAPYKDNDTTQKKKSLLDCNYS